MAIRLVLALDPLSLIKSLVWIRDLIIGGLNNARIKFYGAGITGVGRKPKYSGKTGK